MKKKQSLSFKLITTFTSMILLVIVGLALLSYMIGASGLTGLVDDSLERVSVQAADSVHHYIDAYFKELGGVADNPAMYNVTGDVNTIKSVLKRANEEGGFDVMFVVDKNGKTLSYASSADVSANVADRDYFKAAISGQDVITEPRLRQANNEMAISIAVPIKNTSGEIVGVLVAVRPATDLSEAIADVTYAKTGAAYMISADSTVIAHKDAQKVINKENNFENAKTDKGLNQLVELQKKMVAGETGVGQYTYEGVTKFMGYAPVEGTTWSLAVAAPKNEVFSSMTTLATSIVIVGLFFLLASVIASVIISQSIANPVKKVAEVAAKIADGDLDVNVHVKSKDEIGALANAFNRMAENLNETMNNINSASEQVASGSKQLSESSISLSKGATEQASSVEELTASLEEISSQTQLNADNASKANDLAKDARNAAKTGNDYMSEMMTSINEINSASTNISKIIKVIDDIAFQTNILALNATVEAARAGQHGKGFAVVAEEVRNLAVRSANAAKETTAMIETSIEKAQDGAKKAKQTADALTHIVGGIGEVAKLVDHITTASNEQATGLNQINQGVMQVSQVIQTNSSNAEESAAASEELASQAELLKEQVSKFKLKNKKSSYNSDGMDDDMRWMMEHAKELRQYVPKDRKSSADLSETKASAEEGKKRDLSITLDSGFGKY